jgi:hypothetical protein
MIDILKNRTFLLILIVVIFITIPLSAQLKRDGFGEAKLRKYVMQGAQISEETDRLRDKRIG